MSVVVRLEEVLAGIEPPDDPVARVAVLVSLNFPDMDEAVAALVRRFTRVTLATLTALGASFELFDTSGPLADPAAVQRCDGLLLLGGGDIDPACYGAPGLDVPNSYGTDRRADHDAMAAIDAAESGGLPVLGICRGSQLINVHRGGTIVPDITDYALHRGGPGEPMFLDEEIGIVGETRLLSILGVDRVIARSGHHQAVAVLGAGLVLAARARDGVIEGFEDPSRWTIGVQWHPEDDDGPTRDRMRLFRSFVEACAAREPTTPTRGVGEDDRVLST
ncbi:putative glutamine amidotransferase [Mumia flava]|uniref:Putative glutamine amidotransferase n=1 Tax=Mumia flava TaxID=1348852 RepID=A0A2M9BF56_9ACTN|nr:gamma-glutamyl-gamma-aminobutyrate hydrolase family protein [Mumia flava]PJJ56572.1 putative glutamine amidotransferase [Mumia flava]